MSRGASQEAYAVVVPTVGRPSLAVLLRSLAQQAGPLPEEVVVVDDRRQPQEELTLPEELVSRVPVRVVAGCGRGPAAARNLGWQLTTAPWVVLLDDDVVLSKTWATALGRDLAVGPGIGGSQGRLHVPLPTTRRPTDWERSTAGLEQAQWATADMAYRRGALLEVHGFDERFPRAYREDADLALRVRAAGWALVRGERQTLHPVRPSRGDVSLRVQRGNADDALMRRLHGPRWRERAGTGRGRLPWHVGTLALGVVGVLGAAASAGISLAPLVPPAGRAILASRTRQVAVAGAVGWLGLTADFAGRRISAGPADPREIWRMLWTSAAIPPAAVAHRVRGWWRHRRAEPWPPRPRAVLFDRDGTLVHDVPYNGDPQKVAPTAGARESLQRLRSDGIRVAVVSNQSGIARGLVTPGQVAAVNREVERRIGAFDSWHICPHGPEDGCRCRKPQPGLVRAAARALRVRPEDCVVIGDIGGDLMAARSAGARSVLVPTPATRPDEVRAAPQVARDLTSALDLVLGERQEVKP